MSKSVDKSGDSRKISIPIPFEDAIAAALKTPPEPEEARPFGKRARPKPDRPVRSKKK